ncbi:BCCT family transporter [Thiohalorhabdus sp.]|uniref:BCCT family transporter n=1 Tax=Thiohalorhabdus sp. TaxID=3094134 RepID=UPI002FC35F18
MPDVKAYLNTHTNPPVFLISLLLILVLVGWGVTAPSHLGDVADSVKGGITTYFGWWYLAAVMGFLIFAIILMFSPYGRIRIGKDDDRPDWGTGAWFSMLFTAGMGIGLVFFGVAEPIFHFQGLPSEPSTTGEAAVEAMHMTIFHWGMHPWAIYIVLGLSMGYFCFRHDLPLRPAAGFYPLIGDGIYGWVGNLIDILAVFGTLFGLATSLGLGASQINAGLSAVFDMPVGPGPQVGIIAVITAVAVASVMLGVDKGIRRLSVANMYGAAILALIVFLAGPTLFILDYAVQATGYYLQHLPWTSLRTFAFSDEGHQWLEDWTLFYWGWWIAWSPFVGMFIARVSRGRTIREFILGTLLAPVGASIAWFCIFGGSAIYQIIEEGNQALVGAGKTDAMFILLQQLPLLDAVITALSLLAVLVVAVFFATSSDSGSLVVDMLTNGGDPHPIWQQRMFWAVTEGVVAAILLVAGAMSTSGDPLSALQTASVASGLPFSIVLVLMCWGLVRQLRREHIRDAPLAVGRS